MLHVKKKWAVVQLQQVGPEWQARVRYTSPYKREALAEHNKFIVEEPEALFRLDRITATQDDQKYSVLDAFRNATTPQEVKDMLVEALLTYKEASSGTKKKWKRAALAREVELIAQPVQRLVTEHSLLHSGGVALLGPDGKPARP